MPISDRAGVCPDTVHSMAVAVFPYFSWQNSGLDPEQEPWEQPSPNLLQIEEHLREHFGGGSMGIHWDRNTSSGVPSEHSWGAALDFGTGQAQVDWMAEKGIPHGEAMPLARHHTMCDWLVDWSAELGIQGIVSIGRSWKSERSDSPSRGWIDYQSGYTGHCHIVTTHQHWALATPVADRLTAPPITGAPDMKAIPHQRFADTRTSFGSPLKAGRVYRFGCTVPDVPDTAAAVLIAVTVVQPHANGFLSLGGPGELDEGTSPLAFSRGDGESSTALVRVRHRHFDIRVSQPCHVICDVQGYLPG